MKRMALLLAVMLLAAPTLAATVPLQWDPNAAADQVTKYTIYQAVAAAGPFVKIADVNAPTVTYAVQNLTAGVYYFRVTATNLWAESGPSNVVSTPPGAAAPKNLIIVVTVNDDGSYTLRLIDAQEFFRVAAG